MFKIYNFLLKKNLINGLFRVGLIVFIITFPIAAYEVTLSFLEYKKTVKQTEAFRGGLEQAISQKKFFNFPNNFLLIRGSYEHSRLTCIALERELASQRNKRETLPIDFSKKLDKNWLDNFKKNIKTCINDKVLFQQKALSNVISFYLKLWITLLALALLFVIVVKSIIPMLIKTLNSSALAFIRKPLVRLYFWVARGFNN